MTGPDRRLSRGGRLARLVALAAALAVLAAGQVLDTNDWFPLGSLSQYATARDMDGTVLSVYLEADTVDGRRIGVPLDAREVGVGRAEIEGQLSRIVDDPSLLQALADARAELRPGRPPMRTLHLMRSERQLRDGVEVGSPSVEELATWQVRPDRAGAGA